MSSRTPININITEEGSSNDSLDNTINEFKEYIIKNNLVLQTENKIQREKIKDFENEIIQKEEEIDKLDERIRYMRGLLQNFNAMEKINQDIIKTIKYENNILKNKVGYYKFCFDKFYNFILYFYIILIIFLTFDFLINFIEGYSIYLYFKTIFIIITSHFTSIFILQRTDKISIILNTLSILNTSNNDNNCNDYKTKNKYQNTFYYVIHKNNLDIEYKLHNLVINDIDNQIKEKKKQLQSIKEGSIGVSEMIDNL